MGAATVPDNQDITAGAFSPNGRTLATTTTTFGDGKNVAGPLELWDVTDATLQR